MIVTYTISFFLLFTLNWLSYDIGSIVIIVVVGTIALLKVKKNVLVCYYVLWSHTGYLMLPLSILENSVLVVDHNIRHWFITYLHLDIGLLHTFIIIQGGHGHGVARRGGQRVLRPPVVRTVVCVRNKTTCVNDIGGVRIATFTTTRIQVAFWFVASDFICHLFWVWKYMKWCTY